MAKKVVSSISVHKIKLMKRGKKKKLLFKKVLDYLKSDAFMFAPLISSRSLFVSSATSVPATSIGVDASEPITEKKKLLGNVKDYLKSDCHMYAPLFTHQPWLRAATSPVTGPSFGYDKAEADRQRESMKKLTEENRDSGQKKKSIDVKGVHLDAYPFARTTAVRHTLLQKETAKHVVQQNCRSSSVCGKG